MTSRLLGFTIIAFALGATGCDKLSSVTGGGGSCTYTNARGFCITPPKNTTPKEGETFVTFEIPKGTKPFPAQAVAVSVTHQKMDDEQFKRERGYARGLDPKTNVVLEDVDLAGGKGFFVSRNANNTNIMTMAIVRGPNDTFVRCSSSIYVTDQAALKETTDACKSVKAN